MGLSASSSAPYIGLAIKTYICLISDQRMQNILPLFQKGAEYDRVIMIASEDEKSGINPKFSGIFEDLRKALSDRIDLHLHPIPVHPMKPASTEQVCRELIRSIGPQDDVTINLTGGTKPMSIGAYNAGFATEARLLYVDTQSEQLYYHNAAGVSSEPFNLEKVDVDTFLRCHGKLPGKPHPSNRFSSRVKPLFSRRNSPVVTAQLIQKVAHLAIEKKPRFVPGSAETDLSDFLTDLVELNLASQCSDGILIGEDAFNFLNGGWLEYYVENALLETGLFMDIVCNLKVTKIPNQIDVACTINGKLGVIECKTGSLKGPDGQDTLSKLFALRKFLGGTFAKSILVITSSKDSLTPEFLSRADEYVSCVMYIEQLEDLGSLIVKQLTSRSRG